jgi:hypothetical protein
MSKVQKDPEEVSVGIGFLKIKYLIVFLQLEVKVG